MKPWLAILAVAALCYLCYEARQTRMATERMAGALEGIYSAGVMEAAGLRRENAEKDQAYSRYFKTAEATIKDLQAQVDRAKRKRKPKT